MKARISRGAAPLPRISGSTQKPKIDCQAPFGSCREAFSNIGSEIVASFVTMPSMRPTGRPSSHRSMKHSGKTFMRASKLSRVAFSSGGKDCASMSVMASRSLIAAGRTVSMGFSSECFVRAIL